MKNSTYYLLLYHCWNVTRSKRISWCSCVKCPLTVIVRWKLLKGGGRRGGRYSNNCLGVEYPRRFGLINYVCQLTFIKRPEALFQIPRLRARVSHNCVGRTCRAVGLGRRYRRRRWRVNVRKWWSTVAGCSAFEWSWRAFLPERSILREDSGDALFYFSFCRTTTTDIYFRKYGLKTCIRKKNKKNRRVDVHNRARVETKFIVPEQ